MRQKLPSTFLVTNKSNIRYLCGFTGSSGWLVLHKNKGFFFVDARYHSVAKKVLPRSYKIIDTTAGFNKTWKSFLREKHIKKIGIEGNACSLKFYKNLKKISPGISFKDIKETLDKKRIIKKPLEIENIAKAQKITDSVFGKIKTWLKPGLSERDIAWKIETLGRELGADDISFEPIVGFNENSASPHHQNSERKLKKGDMILIDMGAIYKGYHSDMTRVIFTKKPTEKQRKIYNIVLRAQMACLKQLKAGITGAEADTAARNIIKNCGYAKQFTHPSGHGVGLDIHELPNLSKKYKTKFPAGTVVTVEPGIYLPGEFGIRIEDMALIGKKRAFNLTKSPKAIQKTVVLLK